MDIFKLFRRKTLTSGDQQDDTAESNDICQLLDNLSECIEEIKNHYKLSKFYDQRIDKFVLLQITIENLRIIVPNVYEIIHNFDFRDVKFSGYRSYFHIIKKCITYIEKSLQKVLRGGFNWKQAEHLWSDYSTCLTQLTTVSKCLFQMMLATKDNKSLFLKKTDNIEIYNQMIFCYNNFSSDSFYGHCLGFYLCETCQVMAKFLCSLQLGLGHAMSVPKSSLEVFVSTVVSGTQNLLWENKRGSQMKDLYNQATVTFCKQFWNLVDHPILVRWSHLVLPYLKVIRSITLSPISIAMPVHCGQDATVTVSPPSADVGFADVIIRLLSHQYRDGMAYGRDPLNDKTIDPASNCILIHCHGGGFVAQSSQSHDGYLRQWAIDLNCPIVSIDYSHAPEYPYPRAHEECFYAYCFVLQNLKSFGCTPDCRVVICGDSAGGNLALGCVVRAIQLNIRLPDAVFLSYPAALVDFISSPARMLGVIDPILPIGVLARCLLAYGGISEDNLVRSINSESPDNAEKFPHNSSNKSKPSFLDHTTFDSKGARIFFSKQEVVSPLQLLEKAELSNDPIMSPLLATDDIFEKFPPISVIASEFDPLLDDSIELCKRIDAAGGRSVSLQVMRNLPHGFLNMASPVLHECMAANKICVEELRKFLFVKDT